LNSEPDLRVIGEASDGLETLDVVERHHPDILVLDLMMPRLGGLEVTKRVKKNWPNMRVVILTMYDDEPFIVEALKAKANAYVLKSCTASELVNAVLQTNQTGFYLSPPLSDRAMHNYIENATAVPIDSYELLTNREREVLPLVAEGFTAPQIAAELHISNRTAEGHRANVMAKLGLRTRSELVQYAIKRGLTVHAVRRDTRP
jgi:DNA-binding NarL/FixJ family response regulator